MADKKLAGNTLALYILTGTSYLFSFITLPYLTRVLGPEVYGKIGFGTAFYTYAYLVIDFGFILSATAEIAQVQGDSEKVSRSMTSASLAKLVLTAACGAALAVLCVLVPQFGDDPLLYTFYLLYAGANALIPDFVYRGLEDMKMVTISTLIVKTVFLIGVFVFVRDASQYLLVPVLYFLGCAVSDAVLLFHLNRKYRVHLCRVSLRDVWRSMADSAQYFVSRVASTFYSSLNTMVLGFVAPGSAELGRFTACNNAVNAGKGLSSPVADSMFPYMIRTKNYRLLIKVMAIGEVVLVPLCIFAGIIAPDLCEWFFGQGYRESGDLLRVLIVLVPLALASYLLAFPALTPMGKARVANSSVVVGAIVQVILLLVLWQMGHLDAMGICIATVITEVIVLAIRATAFIAGLRDLDRPEKKASDSEKERTE